MHPTWYNTAAKNKMTTTIIRVTTTVDAPRSSNLGTKHFKRWAILNLTLALLFAALTVACDCVLRDGLASVKDLDFGTFMMLYRGVTWTGTMLWVVNAVTNLCSMDRVENPRYWQIKY